MLGNGRSRTRFRARAQDVQGKNFSRRLQRSERLPGGGGAGHELEEPRRGCEGVPAPGREGDEEGLGDRSQLPAARVTLGLGLLPFAYKMGHRNDAPRC